MYGLNQIKVQRALWAMLLLLAGVGSDIFAQDLQAILKITEARNQAAQQSQAKIDKVVQDTREIEAQYKAVIKELEGLEVYNTLLQRQLDNQNKEMADLNNSITQVNVIERQVMPLMLRMVDGLDQFVQLDIPFLKEERQKRVKFLRALLERSDVTVAEKFRRLLEAFQIENDYGRTIEAYKGSLEVDNASREVDFLRVGRIALLFQTTDGELSGKWDKDKGENGDWAPLGTEYKNPIRDGLRIARKQIAPNLLLLPVPSAEAAQ